MSHNLMMRDGKAAMAYAGERPWHGLGKELAAPATSAEMVVAAGLDWEPELGEVYAGPVGGGARKVPDLRSVLGPMDLDGHRHCLGVVSPRYRPIGNGEAFSFLDSVIGEGKAVYVTAGALGHGEKVWALVELPGTIEVVAKDEVQRFLLLVTSHDGKGALKALWTPIRVVCQNTLNAALAVDGRRATTSVSIPHVGDPRAKVREAQQVLGLAVSYFDSFAARAAKLAETKVSREQEDAVLSLVFPDADNAKSQERVLRIREEARVLGYTGRGQDGRPDVQGTAWGLLNGITEWIDWRRPGTGPDANPETRLNSRWMGSGARLKAAAFETVSVLAGAGAN